jgi:hypothetical protein
MTKATGATVRDLTLVYDLDSRIGLQEGVLRQWAAGRTRTRKVSKAVTRKLHESPRNCAGLFFARRIPGPIAARPLSLYNANNYQLH